MPNAVYGYASAVIDGKIHIIGGSKNPASLGSSVFVDSNQVFDPQTGNWSLEANIPIYVTYGGAALTQDYMAPSRLYFIGGFDSKGYSGATQIFNPSNNSWSTGTAMPSARAYLGVTIIDDVIYAIGGFDGTNWLNTVEMYKPVGYGTVPPQVQITSPENNTYANVTLTYTANRGTAWVGYSLDSQVNITLKGNAEFSNLSQGTHNVILYANDTNGNMGSSSIVYFSIDTIPPDITIILPQNQSYGSTDIQLTFNVNEATKDLAYSLDDNAKTPIVGNVSLPALSNGSHHLTIYATDETGNADSKTVYFTIAPFPTVEVAAVIVIAVIAGAGGYLFYKRKKTEKVQNDALPAKAAE